MLEIHFKKDKIDPKAVKVFTVVENDSFSSNVLSKAQTALVKKAITQADFKGKAGTTLDILGGENKIILVGLGEKPDELAFQKAGGSLAKKLFHDTVACIYVTPNKKVKLNVTEMASAMAFGLQIGSYRFDKYFTKKKKEDYPSLKKVIFSVDNPAAATRLFKEYDAVATAIWHARDLCNEPANKLTPKIFAEDIKKLADLGLEIEILGPKELKAKKFNTLLSVAQGSVNEPYVGVIKWRGNAKKKGFDLGLVGKGVTFDSGGLSLKPSASMLNMEQDMTGAAVVVTSLEALARQKAPVNVVGVVGLVENMPSGSAARPSDVVTSLSGQTVENLNTDAEGRLVLCDCLWYIQDEFKVPTVIDLATLTGAMVYALGEEYAGLFSNDDKLAADLTAISNQVDEKLWRLPMHENFNKMLNSDIADMKNVGGPKAGSSTAACFLGRFIQDGTKWAHLDIAGVDDVDKDTPLCPKGPSGFGIRLLNKYIRS